LTGLDKSVLKIKTKIVSFYTADSKPVKQEVNGTVILPPLVFPAESDAIWETGWLGKNDITGAGGGGELTSPACHPTKKISKVE
jgi:hypothetical protein